MIAAHKQSTERWPSGRRRSPAKGVYLDRYRGFESLPLRHTEKKPPIGRFFCMWQRRRVKNAVLVVRAIERSNGQRVAKRRSPNGVQVARRLFELIPPAVSHAKPHQVLATNTIEGSEASLVKGVVEVYYPGAGHLVDNIVVWLPESKILFHGYLIRSLGSKNLGYTGDARVDKWSSSIENTLQAYPDVMAVVLGHGKTADIQLLHHTKALTELSY